MSNGKQHHKLPGYALTVAQTADHLAISRAQVFRLIRCRKLPAIKMGRRITRIPAQAVVNIIEGRNGT